LLVLLVLLVLQTFLSMNSQWNYRLMIRY